MVRGPEHRLLDRECEYRKEYKIGIDLNGEKKNIIENHEERAVHHPVLKPIPLHDPAPQRHEEKVREVHAEIKQHDFVQGKPDCVQIHRLKHDRRRERKRENRVGKVKLLELVRQVRRKQRPLTRNQRRKDFFKIEIEHT